MTPYLNWKNFNNTMMRCCSSKYSSDCFGFFAVFEVFEKVSNIWKFVLSMLTAEKLCSNFFFKELHIFGYWVQQLFFLYFGFNLHPAWKRTPFLPFFLSSHPKRISKANNPQLSYLHIFRWTFQVFCDDREASYREFNEMSSHSWP